jgi:4-hydroxybenzoate polyprenyltransferase
MVNMLRKTTEFFIYSNIYVSVCVVALCQSTAIVLGISQCRILPFVFFSTLFAYNFQRLIRFNPNKMQASHLKWMTKHRNFIVSITIISMLLSIYYAFNLSTTALFFLIPASIISLLYPLKLFSVESEKISLRELPYLKIFLIAVVWSIVSVCLVIEEHTMLFSLDVLLLFLSRFCFVIAITIPFDIRDLKCDDFSLKTIPQLYGEEKAKTIAFYSLAAFELFSIIHFFIGDFSIFILLALLLCSVLTAILIFKSSQEKNTFYFSFWVEGASILMLLLIFIIPLAFGIFVP